MNLFTINGHLHPTPPFDFNKTLAFLQRSPTHCGQYLAADTLIKTMSIKGQAIITRLKNVGSVREPRLQYTLMSEHPISEDAKFDVLENVSFYLGLYDDLSHFYQLGASDPNFNPVIKKLFGYHPVKFPSPFETTAWIILARGISFNAALGLKRKFTESYGTAMAINEAVLRAFPEPFQIQLHPSSALGDVLRDPRKTEQLFGAARAFATVELDFLRGGAYETVRQWLMMMPGVSPNAAAFILLRALGRTDRAPVGDGPLLHAASRFYGHKVATSIEAIVQHYGSWQGYWAQYLRMAA